MNNTDDPKFLEGASEGVVLQGVLISNNPEDMLKKKKQLLAVPSKSKWTSPSKDLEESVLIHTSDYSGSEQQSSKSISRLGLSISAQFNLFNISAEYSKSSKESKKTTDHVQSTYSRERSICVIKMMCCEFNNKDLSLSDMALSDLQKLDKIVTFDSKSDVHALCKQFLETYGSHISIYPTFGGIYFTVDEQSNHSKKKKNVSTKSISHETVAQAKTGAFDLSANCNTLNKSEDDKNSKASKTCSNRTTEMIGGPADAVSLEAWRQGLVNQKETWRVIDRGNKEQLIPVWEIIQKNHKSVFENPESLGHELQKCWQQKYSEDALDTNQFVLQRLNGVLIDIRKWNKADENYFNENCLKNISKVKALKDEIEKVIGSDFSTHWYKEFLSNNEVQQFITSVWRCTEKDIILFENKLRMTQDMEVLLQPINLLKDKNFLNISQIHQCIKQCKQKNDKFTFNGLEGAKNTINTQVERYLQTDQKSLFLKEVLCHNLGMALHGLKLYLYESGNKYTAFALTAFLYQIYKGNDSFENTILSDDDCRFLSSQLNKLNCLAEDLVSRDTKEQQTLLFYSVMKDQDETQAMEQVLQMLCSFIRDEMCEPVRQILLKENGELQPDLKHIRTALHCLLSEKRHEQENLAENFAYGNITSQQEQIIKLKDEEEIFKLLGLEKYCKNKLSLRDVKAVTRDVLEDNKPNKPSHLPWYFLRNIMKHSTKALQMKCTTEETEDSDSNDEFDVSSYEDSEETEISAHPTDVIIAVYQCSDFRLKQEISTKISSCQFAVPLLLPASDSNCYFNLWPMRSIIKNWRPHNSGSGFTESSMVTARFPVISFIRVGECGVSKSKLLNKILSGSEQHNFFFHRDLECGRTLRKLSNGLVEVCWYLPSGSENLDIFTDGITILNLRGDAVDFPKQVEFLSNFSSAMVFFVDQFEVKETQFLISLREYSAKSFFTINLKKENQTILHQLKLKSNQIISRIKKNEAELAESLRKKISSLLKSDVSSLSIEEIAGQAKILGIHIDEDQEQNAKKAAQCILATVDFENIPECKVKMLPLQGNLWKEWSKLDKEQSRPKNATKEITLSQYNEKLSQDKKSVRRKQAEQGPSQEITKIIHFLLETKGVQRIYFLEMLKYDIDLKSRQKLATLREEYKKLCESSTGSHKDLLQKLDKQISETSIGLEHVMREIGQIYEICTEHGQCAALSQDKINLLPNVAADLLLDGYPLELLDGDVGYVLINWVTKVLSELARKVEAQSRIFVLTVLGVQGTGKSTLLNTMFGLQLPVSNGRCTKGAFLQIINVSEELKQKLKCDYVFVMDTEGLKAPELDNLQSSYEHDNELATFVIGLSDVTLVNISMENLTEMKDVLEIVLHAFIRMKDSVKIPTCFFVHQNVGDVSANDVNIRDRQNLVDILNKITKAAAKMELKEGTYSQFSDVMHYDPQRNTFYIPGLMQGNPPMASVNPGYSDKVFALKKYVFQHIEEQKRMQAFSTITEFTEHVRIIWKAVKTEEFIFNFQNSLVAVAYNEASKKCSDLEWSIKKHFNSWLEKADNQIANCKADLLDTIASQLKHEVQESADTMENNSLQKLEDYFKSSEENILLVQKYKAELVSNIKAITRLMLLNAETEFEVSVLRQKELQKFKIAQQQYKTAIKTDVENLLQSLKCRSENEERLNEEELKAHFLHTWHKTIASLKSFSYDEKQIYINMENCLQKTLSSEYKQELRENKLNPKKSIDNFEVQHSHLDYRISQRVMLYLNPNKGLEKTQNFTNDLITQSKKCIQTICSRGTDYRESYCEEIVREIDTMIRKFNSQTCSPNKNYECEIKLHICSYAVYELQRMRKRFHEENDPKRKLEKMKDEYFDDFKDMYYEKNETQKQAKKFVNSVLKPELIQNIQKRLGTDIVSDMRDKSTVSEFKLHKHFQVVLLLHLKYRDCFDDYFQYVTNYKSYALDWIEDRLAMHCHQSCSGQTRLSVLAEKILKDDVEKIKIAVCTTKDEDHPSITEFLKAFREKLSKVIRIPDTTDFGLTGDAFDFSKYILEVIGDCTEKLTNNIKFWTSEEILKNLSNSPVKELYSSLHACEEQCPFCGVMCDCTGTDHQHRATAHRPTGLWRYTATEYNKFYLKLISTEFRLSPDICTSLVASNNCFKNEVTNLKYCSYSKFNKIGAYESWHIQKDPQNSGSSYWKWVFYKFSDQFAKMYELKAAPKLESWDIPWEEVKKDLEASFHVNIDEFCRALGLN